MNYKNLIFLMLTAAACRSEKVELQRYDNVETPTTEVVYPNNKWAYTSPANFGFSLDKLAEIKSEFKKVGGEAMVVVKDGYVIISWGDVTKPIYNKSMRKSYLNSLIGIEYDQGKFSLDATLQDLNIDDIQKLTIEEKGATVFNLLTSSSGVYHPGAYESQEQKGARPPRGSFKPGKFFYYNNWDFNALGHIYSKISNKDIFKSLKEQISDEIGMQDFKLEDTKYEFQESKSNFPAYRMKTSARDDARFGYLYLRQGKWKNKQLISQEWIAKSFSQHVNTSQYYYYDYGLMWWIDAKNKLYIARGNSGQFIAISPEEDMVFVFRADPGSIVRKWMGSRVKPQESFPIINKILSAKID